jgi:hypothetical protein
MVDYAGIEKVGGGGGGWVEGKEGRGHAEAVREEER